MGLAEVRVRVAVSREELGRSHDSWSRARREERTGTASPSCLGGVVRRSSNRSTCRELQTLTSNDINAYGTQTIREDMGPVRRDLQEAERRLCETVTSTSAAGGFVEG